MIEYNKIELIESSLTSDFTQIFITLIGATLAIISGYLIVKAGFNWIKSFLGGA